MDITMSRVHSASDTCDIYFTYAKVNHLLYTCSLDPFEDGILLDTPLVCMHRYCWNTTDDEEECKRQGTTTPSAREAWKRRRKKTELLKLERPDIRRLCSRQGAAPTDSQQHQRPDIRRQPRTSGASPKPGHPAPPPEIRHPRQNAPEVCPPSGRTSGQCPGYPATREAPDIQP